MTKETYLKMTQPFRDYPKRAKSLHICNRILAAVIFVSYPMLLLWLFAEHDAFLIRAVCVPLFGFLAITAVRYLINRKRPYEKFGVAPVIPKETRGKSCPSRHVFSAAVIAVVFLMVPALFFVGVIFLVFAAALAVIRVISGVHYISDVIIAFACALGCIVFLF